ncbi:hypothetical protein K461DRAFT_294362 [Myriangium duriaei CBS 260.36]|uniref:Peptidase A1 domain-containing protein n=1 Tax=Myriangium duriaei CBS 260.36 TaxID=1168546 RepID=A0A9P4J5F2_9PEZI|nr:hypothetical protein K461DRAFT_294362 [Myriangium duriaei CBS 260.36]
MLLSRLPVSLVTLLSLTTVHACTSPLALPIRNVTLSNGFVSRGVVLSLGTPMQELAVTPQWPQNNTYLYTLLNPACNTTTTSQAECITRHGGLWDSSASTSRQSSTANTSGAYPFDTTPSAQNNSEVTWSTDNVHLETNTTLNTFAIGALQEALGGLYAGAPQGVIGLGVNATLLSTLKSAGRIASASWGFFFGRDGVTRVGQQDGSLVLGGYDRAKTLGPGGKAPLVYSPDCDTGMVVEISGLVMNFPNGTDVNVFTKGFQAFQACVQPSLPTLMIMPESSFEVMNEAWGGPGYDPSATRSSGVNFWNAAYRLNVALYPGDLTIQITVGGVNVPVRVPNHQLFLPDITYGSDGALNVNSSRQVVRINPMIGGYDSGTALLGRVFFTSAYLMANHDTGTYTIWQANATTDSRLVGLDEEGNDVSQNCTNPSNTTIPAGTPYLPSGGGSSPVGKNYIATGTIVGIAVGGAAGLALLCIAAFLLYRNYQKRSAFRSADQSAGSVDDVDTRRSLMYAMHASSPGEMDGSGVRRELDGKERPREMLGNEFREPKELYAGRDPSELPG